MSSGGCARSCCSSGLQVTEIRDRCYFQSIYFREPGGVLFEVATDPARIHRRRGRCHRSGAGLKLPPWEEPHRTADRGEPAAGGVPLTWTRTPGSPLSKRDAARTGAGRRDHGARPERRAGEHPGPRAPARAARTSRIWRRPPPVARGTRTASWPRSRSNEPGLSSGAGRARGARRAVRGSLACRARGSCCSDSRRARAWRRSLRCGMRRDSAALSCSAAALIGPPGTAWNDTGRFDGTPVFSRMQRPRQPRAGVARGRERGDLHAHGRRRSRSASTRAWDISSTTTRSLTRRDCSTLSSGALGVWSRGQGIRGEGRLGSRWGEAPGRSTSEQRCRLLEGLDQLQPCHPGEIAIERPDERADLVGEPCDQEVGEGEAFASVCRSHDPLLEWLPGLV